MISAAMTALCSMEPPAGCSSGAGTAADQLSYTASTNGSTSMEKAVGNLSEAHTQDHPPFTRKLFNETQRAVIQVGQVLNLSHLDDGAQGAPYEKVDILELVRQVDMPARAFPS